MKPITFSCKETLRLVPEDIAFQILDLANWSAFRGYGPVPGVRDVEFDVRTPGIVGTRFRVTNTDGSKHVEEIVDWLPAERVCLEMTEFSPPLSYLAIGFEEKWEFTRRGDETAVTRSFRLHPRSGMTWLPLWVVSFFLKRAIVRHLREMEL